MRGKTLALAGVGKDAYPSSAKLNEGEARSKARDTMCAKLRNMTNVKRPRPAGVQGFKSPPPHHYFLHISHRAGFLNGNFILGWNWLGWGCSFAG